MTRARTASYGVVTPPPLDRWIDAVLMLCVCLVQGVAATFGMRLSRRTHDWHMATGEQVLPQTKPDIHIKDSTTPTESLSALCRESLLANPRGLASDPLETLNRDSRDKPENDTVDLEAPAGALEACPLARVPGDLSPEARRAQGEGRDPVSAHSALTSRTTVIPAEVRQREELEPRSHAHLRLPPLASGSRSRASGMTRTVRRTTA